MGEYFGLIKNKSKNTSKEKAKKTPKWYNGDMFLKNKKNLLIVMFLFIISFVFSFDLLINKGFPATFDGPTHVTNIAQFYKAIKDGDILPRWSDGFANYGMPIPIIAQQTTSYLGALLNFLFRNVIFSYNMVVFIGAFLSVLFFYYFLRLHTNIGGALLGTFLFNIAPYRILNIYIRGAIPEFFAGIFFPLTLFALYKWINEKKVYALFLFAFSVGGILLTHPFTLVIYSFFFAPYTLYLLYKQKNIPFKILMLGIFGLLGVGLAAYYIIPLFLELKYFYYGSGNRFLPDQYLRLTNYISPAWYYFYKDDIGVRGHFIMFGFIESVSIIVITIITIIRFIKKKPGNILLTFTLCAGWITVFMTSRFAIPIYERISILGKIQHPWRMMSLFIYIVPILIAVYSKNWNKWIIALFIIVIAFFRFPQLYGKNYTLTSESNYFFTKENLHGEVLNIIWTGKTETYPVKTQKPEIIAGKGQIKEKEVHNSWRKYFIQADEKIRMADYTFYFPGWKVYVDGAPTIIEFQDMNYRGVITYYVPPGVHSILVKFEDTKVRMLGNIISLTSFVLFILLFFLRKKFGVSKFLFRFK